MIAAVATPAAPAEATPTIIAPAPYQVSFGRVAVALPAGTVRLVVVVNGKRIARRLVKGRRDSVQVALPPKDSTVRVIAVDRRGKERPSARIGPVYGLPPPGAPRNIGSTVDRVLQTRLVGLLRAYPGSAAAYVHNVRTGAGAAWNARARFPAGSTLKLAIAVEALRSVRGPPAHGSSIDSLMRSMILYSDNQAANGLEVAIAGSTSGGSARVNAMMRSLGLLDSEMYGGYEIEERRPAASGIPIRVDEQPSFPMGKYTSAADLGRLLEDVHLAAGGRGPLIRRFGGALEPEEARYLLYLLVHVADHGKIDRFLPRSTTVAHKAGWIDTARHDNGLVYWAGGGFVAAVMTYSGGGAGASADILAGRVAKTALARFQALNRQVGSGQAALLRPLDRSR
jgi:beta-lactamase class A